LQPLLAQPAGWEADRAWRIAAAAYGASGLVIWAARIDSPNGGSVWREGWDDSRPSVVQSECVPALIAALESTPAGAHVEVIAPTSLRYLVEGRAFDPQAPEHRLANLASERHIWARYALGELEALTNACLERAAPLLARVRWPTGRGPRQADAGYVLYTDGGCTPEACAGAWVLYRGETKLRERAWTVEGGVARDGVRLAEFAAAADGIAATPPNAGVAVVSDHADLSDFGVRLVPAFRPSAAVARVLEQLRSLAAERQVRWFWAERDETFGQRRCQTLIDRQVRAAPALSRFLTTCRSAGLRRVYLPPFEHWLAPREPLVNEVHAQWSATFERRDLFLAAEVQSPRLFLRQLRLPLTGESDLVEAFAASEVAGWCLVVERRDSLGASVATLHARLRSGFDLLALLFEPDVALLVQTRPGATLADALDAAAAVQALDL
jgi:hypothetical protein